MTRQTVGAWTRGALGAVAFWLAGCGTPPGQFVIVQNQVPEPGCVIPSTLGAEYRGEGNLDVLLVGDQATVGYELFPLMLNYFPAPAGGQAGDPNRIALSGFDVDVGLPDDAPAGPIKDLFAGLRTSGPDGRADPLIHYAVPTSGSVASGGGKTASAVDALPAELARRIRATGVLKATPFAYVVATVRARGATLTGDVTSDSFRYPIRVCHGCLVANAETLCPAKAAPAHVGNACNIAQDEAVDCCVSGTGLVCPSVVASP